MKKYFIICISIVLLLVLLVPVPRKIEESYTCHVLDQEDPNFSSTATISFSGTYSDYLFRNDRFEGSITCEEYPIINAAADPVVITVGKFTFQNLMNYNASTHQVNYPGTIHASEDFDSFFIWLMVPDEEDPSISHGRYFLTYPEMTLDEIYTILDSQ